MGLSTAKKKTVIAMVASALVLVLALVTVFVMTANATEKKKTELLDLTNNPKCTELEIDKDVTVIR